MIFWVFDDCLESVAFLLLHLCFLVVWCFILCVFCVGVSCLDVCKSLNLFLAGLLVHFQPVMFKFTSKNPIKFDNFVHFLDWWNFPPGIGCGIFMPSSKN